MLTTLSHCERVQQELTLRKRNLLCGQTPGKGEGRGWSSFSSLSPQCVPVRNMEYLRPWGSTCFGESKARSKTWCSRALLGTRRQCLRSGSSGNSLWAASFHKGRLSVNNILRVGKEAVLGSGSHRTPGKLAKVFATSLPRRWRNEFFGSEGGPRPGSTASPPQLKYFGKVLAHGKDGHVKKILFQIYNFCHLSLLNGLRFTFYSLLSPHTYIHIHTYEYMGSYIEQHLRFNRWSVKISSMEEWMNMTLNFHFLTIGRIFSTTWLMSRNIFNVCVFGSLIV